MTGVNVANLTNTFQHYLHDVTETLNYNSLLGNMVGSDYSWTGNELEWKAHVQRNNGSSGYSTDGAAWPTPTKQDHAVAKAGHRFFRIKLQLSDGAVAAGASGKGVAVDVVEDEMRRGMEDAIHQQDFHMVRDGTGAVGTLVGADLASAATDVPCDPGFGGWDGMDIEIRDTDGTTVHGTTSISTVESAPDSNGDVLVNFGATVASSAAGDFVVPVVGGVSQYNKAITGFDKLIDDSGTFQNINTATYPRYTSYVSSNSGTNRPLTPRLFRETLAGLRQKSGSDANTSRIKMLMTNTMAIEFEELYEGEIRIDPGVDTIGLAPRVFTSALGSFEIYTAPNALPNKIFMCDTSQIVRAVQKPLAWHSVSGGMAGIFRMDHGTAVYTAVASEICQLMIKKRHTSAKIEDVSEDLVTAFGW